MSSRFSAYIAIQPVPSDCSRTPATGSAAERSNGPTFVQPEEAALEDVVAADVLAVYPPGEIEQQLVHDPGQEIEVPSPVDLEHPLGGRRIHAAERPLVRRNLAVGVHVPLAEQQQ
jgi:hypothetical protein